MRAHNIKLSFCLCLIFLLTDISIAQEPYTTKHPFGGDDSSRTHIFFPKDAIFNNFTFDEPAYFYEATFENLANFSDASFDVPANFEYATFHGDANFNNSIFKYDANFEYATFDTTANFNNVNFNKYGNFNSASFQNGINFSDATFDSNATFQKVIFKGAVHFTKTTFKKEIDFRQSNFDSVTAINLEDISFQEGELRFYWEQFKGKDSLRIKLEDSPNASIKDEDYTRIQIIYHKLRDNFIAQGDKASADDVMYELDWQRDEILNEFHWQMYGVFFGYGYQPWRFLLFVVLPLIIMFAGVWYWFYYAILVFINPTLFPKISDAGNLKQKINTHLKQ